MPEPVASDFPALSPREVVIVRGWYDRRPLAEIGADLGVSYQRVQEMVGLMRARGLALAPRRRSGGTRR